MYYHYTQPINTSTVCYSQNPLISSIWPEGAKSKTEVTKRPVTAGTNFKNSIIALIETLSCKVWNSTDCECVI